jgi:hypothetical protein
MNAQKLAYRIAMLSLIEPEMESAAPEQLPALPEEIFVAELDVEHFDLWAGDEDLDLVQFDEECSFLGEINMSRDRRAARRLFRDAM